MAKTGLVVLGVILLLITFVVLQVGLSPEDKNKIQAMNSLCTANVFGVPVGDIGQQLLGKEEDCSKARSMVMLMDYGWIGYALGALFLIFGLATGNEKSESSQRKHSSRHRSKHCGSCGEELEGHEKHCSECGAKV